MTIIASSFILAGAGLVAAYGHARSRIERRIRDFGGPTYAKGMSPRPGPVAGVVGFTTRLSRRGRIGAHAVIGGLIGLRLAGWPGLVVGASVGGVGLRLLGTRDGRSRVKALERQLVDLVDACILAVRGGCSVAQALDVAANEVEEPMASLVARAVSEQRLGASFQAALANLSSAIGTDDARLFTLVMLIHHRSGGNVAAPLEEVASTIRHRIAVRRELRALTAQGRISGAVLGILPIGFFVVLSATSHRELAPVYRSPAGAAMIIGGLVLEGLAFFWIRQLLKVEV